MDPKQVLQLAAGYMVPTMNVVNRDKIEGCCTKLPKLSLALAI